MLLHFASWLSVYRQEAELKPHIQPTLHSGCYESIERLVVAQGKECDDYALSHMAGHMCEFKF